MSEPIVNPDVNGIPPVTAPVNYSKADLDSAAASARRDADAKYKEANDRLVAFEAKEKERLDAELTEVELLKKQIGEYDENLKAISTEKDGYKAKIEEAEKQMAEKVEKEKEGLTDKQKTLVDDLPLSKRLDGITQFKQSTPKPGDWGKGGPTTTGSLEAVQEASQKFGNNSIQFREAYEEYMKTKGR